MYTQQLQYLEGNTKREKLDKLIKKVKSVMQSPADKVGIALHDRDIETAIHVHVGMQFVNPRSLSGLARLLTDRIEQFNCFAGKNAPNNMWSYLFHCTAGSALKYQYDMNNIVYCNFDIKTRLQTIKNQVRAHATTIQMLIADFATSKISKDDLIARIGPVASWEYRQQIKHINRDLLRLVHKQYLKDMHDRHVNEIKTLILAGDVDMKKKLELARWEMQVQAVKSIEVLTPDGGYFSNYNGARGVIIELPSAGYLSGRLSTQWKNLLFDLTQFDRVGSYGNHLTVPLNLEYIIFTVDTLEYIYHNGDCSYAYIHTLDDYNLPKVETDDEYVNFENRLKKASPKPKP